MPEGNFEKIVLSTLESEGGWKCQVKYCYHRSMFASEAIFHLHLTHGIPMNEVKWDGYNLVRGGANDRTV